jgi:hypothetical protein
VYDPPIKSLFVFRVNESAFVNGANSIMSLGSKPFGRDGVNDEENVNGYSQGVGPVLI